MKSPSLTAESMFTGVENAVVNNLPNFSSKNPEPALNGETTSKMMGFFRSNSIVPKFAFLLLIVIILLILVNIGIYLLGYFLQKNHNVTLVNGVINGNKFIDIVQDPANSNAITIYRSNNRARGMEMTWSVWSNIDRVSNDSSYQHIVNKGGNGNFGNDGIMLVNNAPGVYLSGNNNNTIRIIMSTVAENNPSAISESLDLNNFPLGK